MGVLSPSSLFTTLTRTRDRILKEEEEMVARQVHENAVARVMGRTVGQGEFKGLEMEVKAEGEGELQASPEQMV
ncbi:MAG: hypothetical protein MMC33_001700 [Icmadophila ericetorum]|nr:hypothetical protein [Icmadophila ericetorum]